MAIGGKSRILQFLGILIADYVLTSSFGFPRILLQAFVFKAFPPIYLLYYGIYLLLVFRVLSLRLVILAPIIWILVHRSMKLNSLQRSLQRLSCSQVVWCFILLILIGVIFGGNPFASFSSLRYLSSSQRGIFSFSLNAWALVPALNFLRLSPWPLIIEKKMICFLCFYLNYSL